MRGRQAIFGGRIDHGVPEALGESGEDQQVEHGPAVFPVLAAPERYAGMVHRRPWGAFTT